MEITAESTSLPFPFTRSSTGNLQEYELNSSPIVAQVTSTNGNFINATVTIMSVRNLNGSVIIYNGDSLTITVLSIGKLLIMWEQEYAQKKKILTSIIFHIPKRNWTLLVTIFFIFRTPLAGILGVVIWINIDSKYFFAR